MTFLGLTLASRSLRTPDKIAYTYFISEGHCESLTYHQLYSASSALAFRLRLHIDVGERALLVYPAGLDFLIAFFACLIAGIIAVPASLPKGRSKFARLSSICTDSNPAAVMSVSSLIPILADGLQELAPSGQVIYLATDEVDEGQSWDSSDELSPETIAFLQYTSGSTGDPKGVMVSNTNIWHNSACIQKSFRLGEDSVSVSWLPHFHDMGLIDGILQPMYSGFHGVLLAPEAFVKQPFLWLELISHFKATHSGGPTSGYELCIQRISSDRLERLDLSHWISAYCGAEPVKVDTLRLFANKFSSCGFRSQFFYPCYGMAEATLMITGGQLDSPIVALDLDAEELLHGRTVPASSSSKSIRTLVGCGWPWLGMDIVIVNPDSLLRCPQDTVGEIWVSGPSCAKGYWQRKDLTDKAFHAVIDDDAHNTYLRTGDLGFFRDGQLFIAGRLKDVIIVGGQNHYPQDIESSIEKCSDSLAPNRSAVFSVDYGDYEGVVVVQELKRSHLRYFCGDLVFSAVRETASRDHGLSLDAIIIIKPGSIPMTTSGKIQRRSCRDRYLAKDFPIIAQWHSAKSHVTS
jgi:acyl-CoA synthetase (AMP-forming)/AMP-acid ligase II